MKKNDASLEKVLLNENNQKYTINGKSVNLKVKNNFLYVNDKKIDFDNLAKDFTGSRNGIHYVYVSNKLIYVFGVAQDLDTLQLILNENGEKVKVVNDKGLVLIYLEKGKILGRDAKYDVENGSTFNNYYEIIYDGSKVTLKMIND